jgi:hypothetical protein
MSQRVNVSGDDVPSLSQFLTGKFHRNIISLARCSKSQTNAVQCWTLSSVALSGDHAMCFVTMFKARLQHVLFFWISRYAPSSSPSRASHVCCMSSNSGSVL